MADIGGGVLKDFSSSKAWGVNPSAASGTALLAVAGGGSFSIGVGDYLAYSFGSVSTFIGVVSEVGVATSFGQGIEQTFQVVDNRVRLGWQMVFAAYNIEDDVARNTTARPNVSMLGSPSGLGSNASVGFGTVDNPGTPIGAGALNINATPWAQRRVYRHLLPQNWQSGIWTYTDEPMSATEILDSAFDYAWGGFGFARNYHSALNDTELCGLDWTCGIKLSNLVAEINGKAGLEITISGSHTLIWGRKGDGLPPLPDATCSVVSTGASLTGADSGVRVVGDPVRIQRLNLTLEPDWKAGWNRFIDELAWIREVATTFAMPTATKADQLDVAAFARKVTVYQYAKRKTDLTFLDTRPFGGISRAQLPAWVYIRELVYRAYRLPLDFTLHGVPLSSLEIADCLLCNTDIVGEGLEAKQCYATTPIQFYPGVQATAITRGQPLDLINARDIRLFYRNSSGDLRNEWSIAPQFEVDSLAKGIRFAVPTFIDGDPDEGKSIYLRINAGEGDGEDLSALVGEGSDYLDIVVPNPDYEIEPAEVRISLCFMAGRFFKDYGVGPRRGAVSASGLGLHVLDMASDTGFSSAALGVLPSTQVRLPAVTGSFKEVLYNDGNSALDKANAAASSALALSNIQATGGFTRNGVAGTALTPVIDRITVSITQGGGITETVEYAKARSTSVQLAERTLQRIQRTEELFPGQEQLKREIREYRMMARAERPGAGRRARSHRTLPEVFEVPVGSETPGVVSVSDKNSIAPAGGWKAGDLVWLDGAGIPVASGGTFGGVVVSASRKISGGGFSKEIALAYSGRVPVRVAPGIAVNGTVQAASGDRAGSSAGAVTIGRLAHGEVTPATTSGWLLAMVDLGGGGGGGAVAAVIPPFTIVSARPAYIPPPPSAVAAGKARFYVTWGTCNGILPENWSAAMDVPLTSGIYTVVLKAFISPLHDSLLRVTTCRWDVYTAAQMAGSATKSPDYAENGNRPAHMFIPLGNIIVTAPLAGSPPGTPAVASPHSGGGSIGLREYVAGISFANQAVKYRQGISIHRI